MRSAVFAACFCATLFAVAESAGQAPEPPAAPPITQPTPAVAPPAATPAKPPPYSLPWGIRPAQPVSVLRLDTVIAPHTVKADDGTVKDETTVVGMALASYKVTPYFSPFLRMGFVQNGDAAGATNLAAGGTLGVPLEGPVRVAFFLGFAFPLGSGGGDKPDTEAAAADWQKAGATVRKGILTRSAMDNAMFAINDFTIFPGLDVAYVAHGLTVQAEVTILNLTRARAEKAQVDTSKTNLTTGLHVGYFFIPMLSAGVELRYQHWLSTPAAVAADPTGDSRNNVSFAAGVRGHFNLYKSLWIRPGVSYGRLLDLPASNSDYNLIQIDVPILF